MANRYGCGDGFTACQFCHYINIDMKKVIIHMLGKHKGDALFTVKCVVRNCMYSMHTWAAYKQHYKRQHKLHLNAGEIDFNPEGDFGHAGQGLVGNNDNENMRENEIGDFSDKMIVAKYLLSLEAQHKITKTAVDSIICSTRDMLSNVRSNMSRKLFRIDGIDAIQDQVKEMLDEYDCSANLNELSTNQLRKTFYEQHYMYVPPERCFLGSRYVKTKSLTEKKLVKSFGYFIPLAKLVEKLLQLKQVAKFVTEDHCSDSDVMKDVCDGKYVRSHPLKLHNGIFLQFSLSYDDVELQNPLRSNKTHKLAMFYIMLLNIPPQYRSQLNNIYLLAIAKTKDLKMYGPDRLLNDFVNTLKIWKEDGTEMLVDEDVKHVRADLIIAICDSPAAGFLGGFKENSNFAFKGCRMCYSTEQEMKNNFAYETFNLRDTHTYNQQCNVLEDANLHRNRHYWSKMYGLNRRSVLCKITDFPVTANIVQDSMHCLLEGVCAQEIALFLNRIIYELGIVSLKWMNDSLKTFPYKGTDIRNKPNDIEKIHITKSKFLKQKAGVILTMIYVLPLIVGKLCDAKDPYYRNFLACMKIAMTAFSPYADETTAGELQQLMYSYCTQFKALYPAVSIRPKFHQMLHLPSQIVKFGPLRQQNSFRFESKHFFFKQFKWTNFLNLPKSLSEKHALYLAHNMTTTRGTGNNMFVYKGDTIKEGNSVTAEEIPDYILRSMPAILNEEYCLYRTDCVEVDGLEYSCGSAVLLEENEFEGPKFGLIIDVFCCSKGKFLAVQILEVLNFREELNAYEVTINEHEHAVFEIEELENRWPLPIYEGEKEEMFVTNRASKNVLPY